MVSVLRLPEYRPQQCACTDTPRPFWLSPRQIVVIPVAAPFKDYAAKVAQTFHDAGLFAEVDVSDNTLNKKIRNAQTAQWNFIMGKASFVAGHGSDY